MPEKTILDKILPYFNLLVGVFGVVVGWLLYEISFWWRTRHEDKKKLKEILYNLLEVFNITYKLNNMEPAIKAIIREITQKLPQDCQAEEAKKMLQGPLINVLNEKVFPFLYNDFDKAIKKYDESIKSLANIDPILAYQLSGKSSLTESFNLIKDFINNIFKNYPIENIKEFEKEASKTFHPLIFKKLLDDLEGDIKIISKKIGVTTWYKLRKHLSYMRTNPITKELPDELKKIIESIDKKESECSSQTIK